MKISFEKLRVLFAGLTRPKEIAKDPRQNTEIDDDADSLNVKQSYPQQGLDDSGGDPYAALSELAAPEPVERLSEGELARRPSLEQRLSHTAHSSRSHQDGYEVLSEVAAPEPVERHTDAEAARHPSLEQRLSSISH
jgi:hypothetical protein